MLLKMLAAASMLIAHPLQDGHIPADANPRADLSAVRYIVCDDWSGSGFLIGDKLLLTANHVLDGGKHCVDGATNTPLLMFKQDKAHDLALATGPGLPTDIPYIKISCEPFKPGQVYLTYGVTDYYQNAPILRQDTLIATKQIHSVVLEDGNVWAGMRHFIGTSAPGTSGGPVMDLWGYAHGVVNAGDETSMEEYQLADGMMCKH